MSLFSKVREQFRNNKVRREFLAVDKICAHFNRLGIDAHMAPRGRAEEIIYAGRRRSLGVIDIVEGPIRWINVTEATGWIDEDSDGDYLVYGVPDPRIRPGFPMVRLKAVSVKKPFFRSGWWKYEALGTRGPGRKDMELWGSRQVIGVRWEGEDSGLGIVQRLSENVLVPEAFSDYVSLLLANCWGRRFRSIHRQSAAVLGLPVVDGGRRRVLATLRRCEWLDRRPLLQRHVHHHHHWGGLAVGKVELHQRLLGR